MAFHELLLRLPTAFSQAGPKFGIGNGTFDIDSYFTARLSANLKSTSTVFVTEMVWCSASTYKGPFYHHDTIKRLAKY